jgi:hypothetical protein
VTGSSSSSDLVPWTVKQEKDRDCLMLLVAVVSCWLVNLLPYWRSGSFAIIKFLWVDLVGIKNGPRC